MQFHIWILFTLLIVMRIHRTVGATCANAKPSKSCCTGQNNNCKVQDNGVFCWCDEFCLSNRDCCWDYNIECVPGVTDVIVNNNTQNGANRAINIVETTTTTVTTVLPTTTSVQTTSTTSLTTSSVLTATTLPLNTTSSAATSSPSSVPSVSTGASVNNTKNCSPFPVWLNIKMVSNNIPISGETVVYTCKDGYSFPDQDINKQMICDSSGAWKETFVACEAAAGFGADYYTAVEAPGAVYIGSLYILFLVIEGTVIFLMDIQHFLKRLLKKKKKNKGDNVEGFPSIISDSQSVHDNDLPCFINMPANVLETTSGSQPLNYDIEETELNEYIQRPRRHTISDVKLNVVEW